MPPLHVLQLAEQLADIKPGFLEHSPSLAQPAQAGCGEGGGEEVVNVTWHTTIEFRFLNFDHAVVVGSFCWKADR